MVTDGQGTKWRKNIAGNFNRLRVHERYTDDRQTDGRAIACRPSEHEREFIRQKVCLTCWLALLDVRYS